MEGTFPAVKRRRMSRLTALSVLATAFSAVTATSAGATLRIENHNDPAGDPTPISYVLENPNWSASPFPFELRDGEFKTVGQPPGSYTARAVLPAGWKVIAIKCIGPPRPDAFVIDVPNGRVIMNHQAGDEQTCAFTNKKAGTGPPSSGVSPSPPDEELPKVEIPNRPALLGVRPGRRGSVIVTLRIVRSSIIRLRLVRRGRVIATKRVHRRAGKRVLTIAMPADLRRRLRHRGRTQVVLTLKVRVVQRHGGAKSFRYRVIVPL
jgi:hypothetical protein